MIEDADSRARVLHAAAELFLARGFKAVNLRDVASALGMKAASLYHHCPGGKPELYARALEAFLTRYRAALEASKGQARFPEAVLRMADWMLGQPLVDLQRISRVDIQELDPDDASALVDQLHAAVLGPFAKVLTTAKQADALRPRVDPMLAAASLVSLVDGLGFLHLPRDRPPSEGELRQAKKTVRAAIGLLLDGLQASHGRSGT